MDGFNRGEYFRDHGAGFSSKVHFKRWYICMHLGLCNFGLLNSHIARNMSCERMVVRGVSMQDLLKKWQFRTILFEKLMNFTDIFYTDNIKYLNNIIPSIREKSIRGTFQPLVLTLSALFTLILVCALSVLFFPLRKQKYEV